jgi:hypothetical protein
MNPPRAASSPVFALLLFALLAACGPTIGDACTVDKDCANGTCVNRDYTPGGYCSLTCSTAIDACPVGTQCVANAITRNGAGCMRTCKADKDCRTGYVCLVQQGSALKVCVGPAGI